MSGFDWVTIIAVGLTGLTYGFGVWVLSSSVPNPDDIDKDEIWMIVTAASCVGYITAVIFHLDLWVNIVFTLIVVSRLTRDFYKIIELMRESRTADDVDGFECGSAVLCILILIVGSITVIHTVHK